LRESQIEEYINLPTEGSEEATIATSESNNTALDEELEDNFNGIDWDRLPWFMKPIASQRYKKSWVYNYG
jgi:outer membrane PBP1 activator LpoA protein